jgi:hypothetical protein
VAVTPNGFQVIWGEVKGPNLLRFEAYCKESGLPFVNLCKGWQITAIL